MIAARPFSSLQSFEVTRLDPSVQLVSVARQKWPVQIRKHRDDLGVLLALVIHNRTFTPPDLRAYGALEHMMLILDVFAFRIEVVKAC